MKINVNSKGFRYIRSYLSFSKRVVFYGGFGHGNLGDDAAPVVARKLLNMPIRLASKRNYAFVPHAVKTLLIGGGGIFHWQAPYIPRLLLKKEKWKFPVIVFSAGINCDYYRTFSEGAIEKIKKLCNLADVLAVRDELTLSFLRSFGVNKKINIIPDLALALKEEPVEPGFKKEGFTVGIATAAHTEFTTNKIHESAAIITDFVNYLFNKGYRVIFLPFQISETDKMDERRIASELIGGARDANNITLVNHAYSPSQMLYVMKHYCDFILGMRLHANVFSANAGIPFLSLSYNIKQNAFLKMLDLSRLNVPLTHRFCLDVLKNKFEETMQDYNLIKECINKRVKILADAIADQTRSLVNGYL